MSLLSSVSTLNDNLKTLNLPISDQTDNLHQPTDFQLQEVSILSVKYGKISLKNFIVELNYFEDIYNNSTSGKIVVSDSAGLIRNGAFTGTELINIKFTKATGGRPIDKVFNMVSISERHFDINNNFETYTLNFCSEDWMLSERYRVSKSCKKKKISEIVTDILENILQTDKPYEIEDTKGVYDFVLPNKKIFHTINWLATYALPNNGKSGADMLFYENAEGYKFKSLQSLFKQQPVETYRYNPKNTLVGTSKTNLITNNIYRLELLNNFDTLDAARKGAFHNRLITVDPLNRKRNSKDFNYNDYFNKSEKLNKEPVINTNDTPYIDRFHKKLYDAPPETMNSGAWRMMITNSTENVGQYIKGKDQVSNDFFIEQYLPNRIAQLSLSNYIKIKIIVPGNTDILAGKVIDISVLQSKPISEEEPRKEDEILSGRYLVTAVRHIINASRYTSVVELAKDTKITVKS